MCRGVVALRLDGRLQLLDRQIILTLARIVDAQLRVDLRQVASRCPLPRRHTGRERETRSNQQHEPRDNRTTTGIPLRRIYCFQKILPTSCKKNEQKTTELKSLITQSYADDR